MACRINSPNKKRRIDTKIQASSHILTTVSEDHIIQITKHGEKQIDGYLPTGNSLHRGAAKPRQIQDTRADTTRSGGGENGGGESTTGQENKVIDC